MSALVSFMSHDTTSHDWLLDRFVGRLSRQITVTHTHTRKVTDDCLRLLVVSLVHTRLDYGNFVLVGLPAYLQRRLQSVLNAWARLVYHLRRYDHVTDALITLHGCVCPNGST